MARDIYIETYASVAVDGTLKAADNIQITVYEVAPDGTEGALATLYSSRTGPSEVSNPFLTTITGLAKFWADGGDYNIHIHDTAPDPRLADDTIGWAANPGGEADTAWAVGDLKMSAASADHGRWLRLDGRSLSQTEVESALSLPAGDGAAIVTFLGTGSSSKYGSTTAGKIKLADTRRSVPMGAGASSDGPSGLAPRALGSSGGAETVTLSASQSGLPAHGHTASQAAHSHGLTDPGHIHIANQTPHDHNVTIGDHPSHQHKISYTTATTTTATGAAKRVTDIFDFGGGAHDDLTSVDDQPDAFNHRHHDYGETTLAPAIDVDVAATGITMANATPAVTVANAAAAAASASHENMPPFVTVGYTFIRV